MLYGAAFSKRDIAMVPSPPTCSPLQAATGCLRRDTLHVSDWSARKSRMRVLRLAADGHDPVAEMDACLVPDCSEGRLKEGAAVVDARGLRVAADEPAHRLDVVRFAVVRLTYRESRHFVAIGGLAKAREALLKRNPPEGYQWGVRLTAVGVIASMTVFQGGLASVAVFQGGIASVAVFKGVIIL